MSELELTGNSPFGEENLPQTIIKVVGVGGGGNNAINHMYSKGVENVSFAVINTDRQALLTSQVPTKVLIGPKTTKGLGAGNKPEVAAEAAEESAADIAALFDDNTQMVFITAGMGGGTGTGAAPVVARIAKERGLLTIGIVTIPFFFEGERKILKALDGADEMSKYVDALLVINNERLTEIYKDLDFINGFGKADDTLCTAAQSISEIITRPGKINLDFNDVQTTLRDGHTAIISSGEGEGENRVTDSINDALNSPLLKNRDIFSSKHLLFNLYFDPNNTDKPFKMEEANHLTSFISQLDPEVDVIWGLSYDDTLGDKVRITILAAGFEASVREESAELRHKSAAPFSAPKVATPQPARTAPTQNVRATQQPQATSRPAPKPEVEENATVNALKNKKRIEEEYGIGKVSTMERTNIRARTRVIDQGMEDDDDIIESYQIPAAENRKSITNPKPAQAAPRETPQNTTRNPRTIEF